MSAGEEKEGAGGEGTVGIVRQVNEVLTRFSLQLEEQAGRIEQLEQRGSSGDAAGSHTHEQSDAELGTPADPPVSSEKNVVEHLDERVRALEKNMQQMHTMLQQLSWYLNYDWSENGRLGPLEKECRFTADRTSALFERVSHLESALSQCAGMHDIEELMDRVGGAEASLERSNVSYAKLAQEMQGDLLCLRKHMNTDGSVHVYEASAAPESKAQLISHLNDDHTHVELPNATTSSNDNSSQVPKVSAGLSNPQQDENILPYNSHTSDIFSREREGSAAVNRKPLHAQRAERDFNRGTDGGDDSEQELHVTQHSPSDTPAENASGIHEDKIIEKLEPMVKAAIISQTKHLKQQISALQDTTFDCCSRVTACESRVSVNETTARKAEQRAGAMEDSVRLQAYEQALTTRVEEAEQNIRKVDRKSDQCNEKTQSINADLRQLEERMASLENQRGCAKSRHDDESERRLQALEQRFDEFKCDDSRENDQKHVQRSTHIAKECSDMLGDGNLSDLNNRVKNMELRLGTTGHTNESDNIKVLEERIEDSEENVEVWKQRSSRLERRLENMERQLSHVSEATSSLDEKVNTKMDEVRQDNDVQMEELMNQVEQLQQLGDATSTRISIVERELVV